MLPYYYPNDQQVEQQSSWRAHVAEVVSVEYIPACDDHALILTASVDCTARLWTVTGNYIGTFGQVRGRVMFTHITSNSYTGATLEHQGPINISTSTVSVGSDLLMYTHCMAVVLHGE